MVMNVPPATLPPVTPEDIKSYYFKRFEQLSEEQQIHFAWSLYSWNKDRTAYKRLLSLKSYLSGDGDFGSLWQRLEHESNSNTHSKGKMAKIHFKYFSRHPGLLARTWQLLYVLRLQTIYEMDVRPELLRFHSFESFQQTLVELEQDPEAIAMLSAAAINYIYLFNYLLVGSTEAIDPYKLIDICEPYYDSTDDMHLKIQSYLYTHLAIGESLFFNRPIPENKIDKYQMLMGKAEGVLARYYFEHSLDNKYEFLACAHLVGNSPDIESVITNEAANSFYESELYTFDRLNANPNKHKPSVANMAHSMAFYILYNSKRSP